jgi:hypothetical protein
MIGESVLMQVSRTPRSIFKLGTALPGVGEALKQEIAWGWSLRDQLGLWGFAAMCDVWI